MTRDAIILQEFNSKNNGLRWAVLKAADGKLTSKQAAALAELEATDLFTATAWRIKAVIRQRAAWTVSALRIQRSFSLVRHAREGIAGVWS